VALALTFLWLGTVSTAQLICTTNECKNQAEKMKSKINDAIDYCDDFYEFACGNYNPEIPNDKASVNSFSLILDSLQERLNIMMSSEIDQEEIEPFKNVKRFYQNCLDTG
jgi:predicted metalloendopeptidase